MSKLVGIFKELEDDEKILTETPDFVRIESNTSELSSFDAKVYLTNKKLLFLIAKIFDWKKEKIDPEEIYKKAYSDSYKLWAGKKPGTVRKMLASGISLSEAQKKMLEVGEPIADSTSLVTSWMEIPLHTIKRAYVGGRKNQVNIEFNVVDKGGFLGLFRSNPEIVVHASNSDMWHGILQNTIKEHRVRRGKELGEPLIDERNRYICSSCGTHYEKDKVKMVKCKNCNEFVCREKLVGAVFKNWTRTNCLNEKNICTSCASS